MNDELKAELVYSGLVVATDSEMDTFLQKMKAHQDAMTDRPDVLPAAGIDFIPEAIWDEGDDPLHLLTPDEYGLVPDGAMLVTINDKVLIKGQDNVDMDIRFGVLAVGFCESQLEMEEYGEARIDKDTT